MSEKGRTMMGRSSISNNNNNLGRRDFLKLAGVGGAALLGLGGCGAGNATTTTALPENLKPEKTDVTLGFISLTDCSPLVIASEKGLFKKYGLDVKVKKQASWKATIDAVHSNQIDGAHILLGIVVGSTLGVGDVGTAAPKKVPMCVLNVLNINGQAITLKKSMLDGGLKTPDAIKKHIDETKAKLTFAMTFPTGTHAMWMRYWLASGGIHPDKDVKLITIPPPQMVENMKTGNMDGFCVGEPWGARAVTQGIGGTGITTQGIWKNHPEKVLGVTEEFANKYPNTSVCLTAACLEAAKWLDDMKNRAEAAEIVGASEYINCPPNDIRERMLGNYIHAPGGAVEKDADPMYFYERNASVPYLSHATWFMSQHRRWGMLTEKPDYTGVAKKIMRQDIYTSACKLAGLPVAENMESRGKETLFDGSVFDPADPEGYAQSFKIKA